MPLWASVSFFVPIALPSATEATTKTIQPNTAVFQWRALQRPILAAMLCGVHWGFPFVRVHLHRKGSGAQSRMPTGIPGLWG